jgi:hypothetical protein
MKKDNPTEKPLDFRAAQFEKYGKLADSMPLKRYKNGTPQEEMRQALVFFGDFMRQQHNALIAAVIKAEELQKDLNQVTSMQQQDRNLNLVGAMPALDSGKWKKLGKKCDHKLLQMVASMVPGSDGHAIHFECMDCNGHTEPAQAATDL